LTSELVRLGARKLIQELLEAEVTEVLGREPYERRTELPVAAPAFRGWRPPGSRSVCRIGKAVGRFV